MHKYFTECAWSIAQQTGSAQCICSYVSLLALGVSVSNLPARAIVLNMKQHNGRFACIYCNDEGVSSQHCPMHRWWPYKPGLHCRSDASVTRAARKALMSSDAVSV